MKIAIVTPVFPPYHGGMGRVACAHALLLSKNHSVTVFTPAYRGHQDPQPSIHSGFGIEYLAAPLSFGNAARMQGLINRLAGYDLVFLHYPFFGTAELLLSRQLTNKIYMYYHMDPVGLGWKRWIFFSYRKVFLHRILARCDRIFVSSFDYAKHSEIKNYLAVHPEKCFELSIGIDPDDFFPAPKKTELVSRYHLAGHQVFVFVGGLDQAHYFKGLEYLISAFKEPGLEQASLMVVGTGNRLERYKKKSETLGLSGRIHFVAAPDVAALRDYYNLADAVVLPSVNKAEAFGIVLLEAMACQKPVIATRLHGVRTLINEGVNGYLAAPKDARDLARAMAKYINDGSTLARLGQNGRQMVLDKYTWQAVGKILDFHLAQVV